MQLTINPTCEQKLKPQTGNTNTMYCTVHLFVDITVLFHLPL